jgi:hypothetical protein
MTWSEYSIIQLLYSIVRHNFDPMGPIGTGTYCPYCLNSSSTEEQEILGESKSGPVRSGEDCNSLTVKIQIGPQWSELMDIWWMFDGYHGIAGLQYLSWHRAKMSKALETDGNSWIGLAAVWRHFEPLLVWCVACCFLGVVVCSHDPYVLQLAWQTFFGFRCFSRLCGVAFHCFPNFCRRWLHSGHGLASACALHCTTPSCGLDT